MIKEEFLIKNDKEREDISTITAYLSSQRYRGWCKKHIDFITYTPCVRRALMAHITESELQALFQYSVLLRDYPEFEWDQFPENEIRSGKSIVQSARIKIEEIVAQIYHRIQNRNDSYKLKSTIYELGLDMKTTRHLTYYVFFDDEFAMLEDSVRLNRVPGIGKKSVNEIQNAYAKYKEKQ